MSNCSDVRRNCCLALLRHRAGRLWWLGLLVWLAGAGAGRAATSATLAATSIGSASATLNASVNPAGVSTDAVFEYSTNPGRWVSTLAGNTAGYADGTGTGASFFSPQGVGLDSSGNLYVADSYNHCIRKITLVGDVTTFAGSTNSGYANGTGSAARFNKPAGLAVDSANNLYVADEGNNCIRKITSAGVVTTLAGGSTNYGFADGTGNGASFAWPDGVALDSSGNLWVADTMNNRIRKVTSGGVVTTLAGTGTWGFVNGAGNVAQFKYPVALTLDSAGNIYVADERNNMIRKITPAGAVSTFAGSGTMAYADGTGLLASFDYPRGLAFDSAGNLFVADSGNSRLRKITPDAVVTTVAGNGYYGKTDGPGTQAYTYFPEYLVMDRAGNVWFSTGSYQIRQFGPLGARLAAQSGLTGSSAVAVSQTVTGLLPGTTYYFCAVTTNSLGTVYGDIRSFTTTLAATTTTLASSVNPSTYGSSVTFTATVAPSTASGTVTLKVGGTTLSSATLSGGTATFTTSALGAGARSITAEYAGNASYSPSTNSPLTQTVNKATPTVSTWPTATPITPGQTLAASTLSGGSASVAGTFAFTTPSTVPAEGTTLQGVTFTPTDIANYTTTSGTVSVSVGSPAITAEAQSAVVVEGGPASLSVTCTGTAPLRYQWLKDGVMLVGQTNQTLTFASFQFTNSGSYRVVVTNAGGLVISRSALLSETNAPLQTWGDNGLGQLGNGSYSKTNRPVSAVSNVVAAAAGSVHSLFVKADGTLWTMGRNNAGQLGNGSNTDTNQPMSVASNVVAVAAGSAHSLFLKADGTLWAMGYNYYGQLGNGSNTDTNRPVSVASNVVAVAAGDSHSLFLKADGTLWEMGRNNYGQLGNGSNTDTNRPVSVAGNVVAVAAGGLHSLFVKADGTLWGMGYNNYGQLGNGSNTDTNGPVSAAGNVVAVAAGGFHSLFVKADGTLWAMGNNGNGQLGNGSNTDTNRPVSVASNVVAVAAGYLHSLLVTGNGTLWAMGYNGDGELGNGSYSNTNRPVSVVGLTVASLGAMDKAFHSLAVGAMTKSLATVTLSNLAQTYDGTAKPVTATTSPTNLLVNLTYDGISFAPTNAGSYTVIGTVSDANYTGSATNTLVIGKGSAAVTPWPTASAIIYGQTLASSTLSGGSASVAGTFAWTTSSTAPGAGSASQGVTFTPTDTANYNTATGTASVTVNKATPTVTPWPTASAIIYGQTLASSTLSGGSASVAGSFAWTTPTTAPNVGTASQDVTFTPTDTANYTTTSGTVSVTVHPATRLPVQSGSWNDPATWGGTLPAAGDDVTIPAGLSVTLNADPPACKNLTIAGTLNLGANTLQISGNFTNNGTFNPGTGTVQLVGGADQSLAATAPGALTFYNLTVNKDPATAKVTATSKLKATKKLTITKGKLISASDYGDVLIETDGTLELTSDITIAGDLVIQGDGTLTPAGHTITFDGGIEQRLTVDNLFQFDDLTVTAGTTLIETESANDVLVNGTLLNQGIIRKTQAVTGVDSYDFGLAGSSGAGLELDVTALSGADPLTALQVDRVDANPTNAPGTNTTGIYWVITPTGSDFTATLILPHDDLPAPQVCRYSGTGWSAARSGFTPDTVTRAGLTAFGEFAVFNGGVAVAVCDTLKANQNTAATVAASVLTANDTVADGCTLSLTGVTYTGGHGGAVELSKGRVTYTPATGYTGSDTFTYSLSDGFGGVATGTVQVSVAPPVAPDQTFTRAARLTLKILKSVVLAACSSPDGYPLALTGVGTSSQGAVLSLNATYIFYTPAAGNDNNDSFSYTVADGHGGSFTGTIHVTVVATTGGQAQQISASGGRVTVQFAGIPGYTYRVLRATDAAFTQDVTTLDTITAPANGLFSYTDLNPPNPTAYYRMQTP